MEFKLKVIKGKTEFQKESLHCHIHYLPTRSMGHKFIKWVFSALLWFQECHVKEPDKLAFFPFLIWEHKYCIGTRVKLNYKDKLDEKLKIKLCSFSFVRLLQSGMEKLFQSPKYTTYSLFLKRQMNYYTYILWLNIPQIWFLFCWCF